MFGLTTSSISFGEVTSLDHEVVYDSVELAAFVAFTFRFLGQLEEVLCCLRDSLSKQANYNGSDLFTANPHIKTDLKDRCEEI